MQALPRQESLAYPKTDFGSRVSYFMRQNSKAFLATIAFLAFVLVISLDQIQPHPDGVGGSFRGTRLSFLSSSPRINEHFGGAAHKGYFTAETNNKSEHVFHFASVTDLDQLSHIADSKKPTFRSILLPGTITFNPEDNKYAIDFEETRTLTSQHNEAGRGMELSELTVFQDRLLTFDDRTGTVFEVLSKDAGAESHVVPRFVITEGEGDTDKGMKWEWATVKNGELYMGSMGKEYTNPDGSIANTNNLWIGVLNQSGELRREDWVANYNVVREALGASPPGYLIHEAVLWSPHMKKWIFIPRRISSTAYDENEDERKGSYKLCMVDEDFTNPEVIEINMAEKDPLHGFSTFAFVPGTGDKHALAVRTVEEDCVGGDESVCKQRSYFLVFDVTTGEVLLDETRYSEDVKFEGIEFVNVYTPETTTDASE
uniref:Apyrase n=1 Tax=Grammatophora oceanica TaxID=210454 RepID=A0A7S1Y4H1_9STRA|mmetsp:Transcript_27679/g.40689  ORF Transcript_27679/g.40689 Transcript_27679/m.40689 type:complete len:429 (+) Transcript_27679:287-1573(+)|eukprot:CAMPEP_0194033762 /NCGR_PEP_ID=MMETSP0009_2-20130614/6310_1 /TAXON_ID=210454 /ORGANISM="Grammatophora oceanica, Strain CCMP 410" /LENGTH=428 /DNA_ID=CAMNT_0038674481 /DNA_START=283 /DNA_END=1569 /DNA_ORIENTATION=-